MRIKNSWVKGLERPWMRWVGPQVSETSTHLRTALTTGRLVSRKSPANSACYS